MPKKEKVALMAHQIGPMRRRVKTKATREQYLGVNVEDEKEEEEEGPSLVHKRKGEASQDEVGTKKKFDIIDTDREVEVEK